MRQVIGGGGDFLGARADARRGARHSGDHQLDLVHGGVEVGAQLLVLGREGGGQAEHQVAFGQLLQALGHAVHGQGLAALDLGLRGLGAGVFDLGGFALQLGLAGQPLLFGFLGLAGVHRLGDAADLVLAVQARQLEGDVATGQAAHGRGQLDHRRADAGVQRPGHGRGDGQTDRQPGQHGKLQLTHRLLQPGGRGGPGSVGQVPQPQHGGDGGKDHDGEHDGEADHDLSGQADVGELQAYAPSSHVSVSTLSLEAWVLGQSLRFRV